MDSTINFSIDSAEGVMDKINFLKQVLAIGLGRLRSGLSWNDTTIFFSLSRSRPGWWPPVQNLNTSSNFNFLPFVVKSTVPLSTFLMKVSKWCWQDSWSIDVGRSSGKGSNETHFRKSSEVKTLSPKRERTLWYCANKSPTFCIFKPLRNGWSCPAPETLFKALRKNDPSGPIWIIVIPELYEKNLCFKKKCYS